MAARPERRLASGIAVVLVTLAFILGSSPDVQAQTPGLVAAYGFNEASGATTTDSSGTGNHGTQWVPGGS